MRIFENHVIYVCPKCVHTLACKKNEEVFCGYCHTQMIETTVGFYDGDELEKKSPDEYNRMLFENYVKDNPLYDPDEETRTFLKVQEKKRTAQMNKYIREQQDNTPKCPNCKSTNIERISSLKKGVSIGVFGLMSSDLGKTMVCKDCKYKW